MQAADGQLAWLSCLASNTFSERKIRASGLDHNYQRQGRENNFAKVHDGVRRGQQQSLSEHPIKPLAPVVQEGTTDSAGKEDAITSAMEPPFAKLMAPFVFWQDLLLLIVLGGVIGCFGYGYLKAMDEVTNLWLTADGNSAFPDDPETLQVRL